MEKLLSIAKALSDSHRLRSLLALSGGELCVCQLVELLKLSPSTVSKHLSVLRHAGLVTMRKEGRWAYYGLPSDKASDEIQMAIHLVERSISNAEAIKEDQKRLSEILKEDKEQLCKRMYGS